MHLTRTLAGLTTLLLVGFGSCTSDSDPSSLGPVAPGPVPPGPVSPVASDPCGGIGGLVRSQTVTLPQRGGGTLEGKLFAPDSTRQTGACPAISLLPGGGAGISSVEWAATRLAANGYVVLITKPASGGSTASYHTAAVSGIDFLLAPANPYRRGTDSTRIGAAGWSLGARALTRTQAEDPRLDAIIAWDNLAVSESGDAGSPACTNQPEPIRTARVPALGQASDSCQSSKGAEAKKVAYERWRAAGVPVMQVVFAGSSHFLWSAQGSEAGHDLSHFYTQAWFDRWLKADTTATERLLARSVRGRSLDTVLSSIFRSAVFVDGRACADLRAGCR